MPYMKQTINSSPNSSIPKRKPSSSKWGRGNRIFNKEETPSANRIFNKEDTPSANRHLKKMFKVWQMQIKTMRYYFTSMRILYIRKDGNNTLQSLWVKGPLLHCWWECKLVQAWWKKSAGLFQRLEMELSCGPAIPLLNIYSKEVNTHPKRSVYTYVHRWFIVVQLVIVQIGCK